jgi:hypothetical protein
LAWNLRSAQVKARAERGLHRRAAPPYHLPPCKICTVYRKVRRAPWAGICDDDGMSLLSIFTLAPPPAPVRRDLSDPRARPPVRIAGLDLLAYSVTAAALPAAEKSQSSLAALVASPENRSDAPAGWLPPGPVWLCFSV